MWIAQLSDPHLRPDGVLYQGVLDTNAVFEAAVRQVDGLDPAPDLVLLTGDVADTGNPAEYAVARRILAGLRVPVRAIPGNHDEREAFRAAFETDFGDLPTEGPLNYVDAGSGEVRVVALDVTVPGLHHGEVPPATLDWLDSVLGREPSRPTLVMMHQPPLLSGIPYLDEYRCFDAEPLAHLLTRYPAVECVLCGHVHRTMTMRFAGTLLCTAPSTSTAIALRPRPGAEPASYLEPPGFLLHHWDQGRMLTHVVPVGDFPGPFGFA